MVTRLKSPAINAAFGPKIASKLSATNGFPKKWVIIDYLVNLAILGIEAIASFYIRNNANDADGHRRRRTLSIDEPGQSS